MCQRTVAEETKITTTWEEEQTGDGFSYLCDSKVLALLERRVENANTFGHRKAVNSCFKTPSVSQNVCLKRSKKHKSNYRKKTVWSRNTFGSSSTSMAA